MDAHRTGSNRAGVYTGVWTAGETLGLAVGPGLFGLLLAAGGYVSSTGGGTDQPDSAVTAARRLALNEDWAATVVGLLLLALVLTGLLPGWLVP